MPDNIPIYAGIYLVIVNLWAIVLTAFDKSAAQCGSRRIKERTLLLVSAIGGSLGMLLMMRRIRHKTQHAKFMVGIPVIILLQIAAALFIWWWRKGGVLH